MDTEHNSLLYQDVAKVHNCNWLNNKWNIPAFKKNSWSEQNILQNHLVEETAHILEWQNCPYLDCLGRHPVEAFQHGYWQECEGWNWFVLLGGGLGRAILRKSWLKSDISLKTYLWPWHYWAWAEPFELCSLTVCVTISHMWNIPSVLLLLFLCNAPPLEFATSLAGQFWSKTNFHKWQN